MGLFKDLSTDTELEDREWIRRRVGMLRKLQCTIRQNFCSVIEVHQYIY